MLKFRPASLGRPELPIGRVPLERDQRVRFPGAELERAGAVGMAREVGRAFRHDGERRELREQWRGRGGERDPHPVRSVCLDALDHREAGGERRAGLGIAHARDGGGDVGGRHRLAVVKARVGAQLEDVGEAVGRYGPGGGERGHDAQVGIDGGQALVDRAVDHLGGERGRDMRVEPDGRLVDRDLQGLRDAAARQPHQHRQRADAPGQNSHGFLPPR